MKKYLANMKIVYNIINEEFLIFKVTKKQKMARVKNRQYWSARNYKPTKTSQK